MLSQQQNSLQAVLIFIGFLIVMFSFYLLKKIYYKVRYKEKFYIFPRTKIKGITSIAMVISLSVAVLILLTIITSNVLSVFFRAFPGTRVTLEGILIKIGGLLFGPFLGLFIGAFTDLLAVTLTAGVFHYGYFIAAMSFGLLSGFVKIIFFSNNYFKNKKLKLSIFSTIFISLISAIIISYFMLVYQADILPISFLPFTITKFEILYFIVIFLGLFIASIWVFYFLSVKRDKTNRLKFFNKEFSSSPLFKKNFFYNYCPILICILFTEIIINVLMMPAFDADLSTLNFETWLGIRVLMFVPMVILNLIVIFPSYTIISPLVKYDYKKDQYDSSKNYNRI